MVERMRLNEMDLKAWREIIVRATRVKIDAVAADPLERGARAVLNLGHTIGHALEHAARGRLSHGAAVAVGLRGAGLLALRLGRFSAPEHARILRVLQRVGLPLFWNAGRGAGRTARSRYERDVLSALRHDKKRANGAIRFVLPEGIGRVSFGVAVDAALVRDAVRQCAAPPQVEETME
jgi:3-dehydroquinate synthase